MVAVFEIDSLHMECSIERTNMLNAISARNFALNARDRTGHEGLMITCRAVIAV